MMSNRAFKSCILLLLSFTLSFCSTSKEQNEKVAYSHFKLGVTLISQGKKEQGLEQLLLAKRNDPENPLILNHLGLAYFFMNEHEHAIVTLKEAIEKNPNYSEAQNNLGRVYIEIRDYKSAQYHLDKAASDLTYANKDKVWLNFGLSFFKQNQFEKSEPFFLKSITANRNNCLAYNYYGRSLVEREQYKKAAKALDQAIYHCQKKGFDEPHYYSAISFYRLGYTKRAIARLEEGKKKFPNGPNRQKIDEMINLMEIATATK